MKIERLKIAEIRESSFNPRIKLEKNSSEYKAIKNSIQDYGFVEPIVVNDVNMNCLGGHQRLAVLRDMGEREIDCVIVHIENSEKEKALCVALNKIKGDWDEEKLDALLTDPKIREFETGFENMEISLENELNAEEENDFESDNSIINGYEPKTLNEIYGEGDDVKDINTVVMVGVFKFELKVSEYTQIISGIRDKGIFDSDGIIAELKRKLFNA